MVNHYYTDNSTTKEHHIDKFINLRSKQVKFWYTGVREAYLRNKAERIKRECELEDMRTHQRDYARYSHVYRYI